MEVELPRAVPPEMGFDLHGVSEGVGACEVIFFDAKGADRLAAVQGAVIHPSREGGIDRVRAVGELDVESDAGAVGEFAPFVGAEDGVGFGDGGAAIEEFDFASDTTNHQIGFGKWFRKVGTFGWKRLFRFLPGRGGWGQKEGGEAFGGPVGGSAAGVALSQGNEFVNPAETEETLGLLDGVAPEEVEIFRTDPAGLAMGKWRAFAEFGEGERGDSVEAVGEGSAEGNVFTGSGEEVGVVGQELAGEVLPAFGPGRIVLAEESTPPEAVVVEGVGVVVVDRLVGSIAKPAVADGHRFECVEPLADLRCIGFLPKTFFFEKGEGEDAEEEVIVGVEFGSANRGEPSGNLFFFFLRERIPKKLAGDFEGQHEGGHFDGMLMVVLGGAPVFRGGGVGSEKKA